MDINSDMRRRRSDIWKTAAALKHLDDVLFYNTQLVEVSTNLSCVCNSQTV